MTQQSSYNGDCGEDTQQQDSSQEQMYCTYASWKDIVRYFFTRAIFFCVGSRVFGKTICWYRFFLLRVVLYRQSVVHRRYSDQRKTGLENNQRVESLLLDAWGHSPRLQWHRTRVFHRVVVIWKSSILG